MFKKGGLNLANSFYACSIISCRQLGYCRHEIMLFKISCLLGISLSHGTLCRKTASRRNNKDCVHTRLLILHQIALNMPPLQLPAKLLCMVPLSCCDLSLPIIIILILSRQKKNNLLQMTYSQSAVAILQTLITVRPPAELPTQAHQKRTFQQCKPMHFSSGQKKLQLVTKVQ